MREGRREGRRKGRREEAKARAAGLHTYLKSKEKGKMQKRMGKEAKGGRGHVADMLAVVALHVRHARIAWSAPRRRWTFGIPFQSLEMLLVSSSSVIHYY